MLRDELASRARTGLTTLGVVRVDITAEPALLATYGWRSRSWPWETNEAIWSRDPSDPRVARALAASAYTA